MAIAGCRRLLAYYPLADELPLQQFFKRLEQPIYLPVIAGKSLTFRLYRDEMGQLLPLMPGPYGVLEPAEGPFLQEVTEEDAVLLPALGCNPQGVRLGRGGGYYDRSRDFLSRGRKMALLPEGCTGLSFPAEAHDMRLDLVLTENKTVFF